MHRISLAASVVPAVLTIAGCATSPEDTDPAPPADTIERTIVRVAADGSYTQTFETVTSSQSQAEQAGRATLAAIAAAGGDPAQGLATLNIGGCALSDLWLFDGGNLTGNELCLFKSAADSGAWLTLSTVCRSPACILTWSNAVRSLYAGSDAGSLQACTPTLCSATEFVVFAVYQRINTIAAGAPLALNTAFLHAP
jgi:hypothetical protein